MANSKLEGKSFNVPKHLQKYLGTSLSYPNLKMTKTRLNNAKTNNLEEFNKKGGDNSLKWVEETLNTNRQAIYGVKKTGMDAGRENEFIKTHDKDHDNANPTAVGGLPKINKGNISRKIMSGKEVYNEEIRQIRYLIEYMDNNKKNKLK
jgi:hypothetical protein